MLETARHLWHRSPDSDLQHGCNRIGVGMERPGFDHLGRLVDERPDVIARYLAAIVDSSDDAIISHDLNGTITSWNKGAERLYGYASDEVIGQPVAMLHPVDRDEEAAILDRVRRGEHIEHYETVRRRKDGSLVEISL